MTSNVAGFSDERFASSACIDAHRNSAPAELSPRVPGQPLDATAKDPSPGKCPTQTHASPGQACTPGNADSGPPGGLESRL